MYCDKRWSLDLPLINDYLDVVHVLHIYMYHVVRQLVLCCRTFSALFNFINQLH